MDPDSSGPAPSSTLFLLSPALLSGVRGRLLTARRAAFPAAAQLRQEAGIPIADLFSFVSALYFRGKIAYARRFASASLEEHASILVIAPGFGLVTPEWPVTLERLRRLARTPVDPRRPAYWRPLQAEAAALGSRLPSATKVVLLGSLASGKYLDILLPCLGGRLHYPLAFAGTGDMQRGSLMLAAARSGVELGYAPCTGAIPPRARRPTGTPSATASTGAPGNDDPDGTGTPR